MRTAIGYAVASFMAALVGMGVTFMLMGAQPPPIEPKPATGLVITEDDPRWDCTTMGNQVCGPGNDDGARPGFYLDGQWVAPWEARS